ncbi:unnamed protein product [Rotaria sp. Silwood2]|nr:unnamed protein product [Rotaria sp. Silwood2]CAF3051353.1 unnamed protein product [Rotaria sp. Silwood2]CAF3876909.1 unnamed protein product [Rotaria sp. Silwood2]
MGKSSKKNGHKHKKHQHHRRRSTSSSSNSNKNEEQWKEIVRDDNSNDAPGGTVVKGPTMPTQADLEQLEKEKPAPVTFALEPFDFDSIGSYQRENKQAIKKAQTTAEMEAIMNERELNPALRQQSIKTKDSKPTKVGDAGLEWHQRAYERCKQQAKDQQRPLNEIVSERYGSVEKLMSLINDAEDLHHRSSSKKKFLDPNEKDDRHHRHRHHHHEKKSWKRTTDDDDDEQSTPKKQARTDEQEEVETADVELKKDEKEDELVSEENLLELRKQLIRAELAGDDEMTELLRNEIKHIDSLRGNPQQDSMTEQQQRSNDPKVLLLTTIDRYGVEKPVHNAYEPGHQRQYGHVEKRDRRKMKKEIRKMRENDKDPEREGLSLNDLVEMERHSTTNTMPVLPSNRNNQSMTADRQLLASTRHLSGWSRIQALAEQKKRQKTFEECWLCIENLSKSFIFGLLDQWYLCAPPQQSLVDGHCFIVPIQHSSSRFHLGKISIRIDLYNIDHDDVLSELDILKEQLSDLYRNHHNQVPIFIETFKNPRLLPHMYIECIPVPVEQANLVPMYFRKALLESESMWSTNKKIIELNHHRSRTLKSVIPKGLPYFCVEFPADKSKNENLYGYAHMIEERGQFPLYFGREILGGLMQIDNPLLWMRPSNKEPEDIIEKKCTFLKQLWKKNINKLST